MKIRMNQMAVVLLVALMAAGCTAPAAAPTPTEVPAAQPSATSVPISAAVVDYAGRLSAGDLEGTLALFHDDAHLYLLGLPPGGFEMLGGKEQIRAMLEENIASHFKMEAEVLRVVDDVVTARTSTWHDFTRQLGVAPLQATGVYVIKAGKIASVAWYVSEESLARLKIALAETMLAGAEQKPATLAPGSQISVTFAGGTCVYDGPKTLKAGEIAVTMDVRDQDREKYGLAFFNPAPGKDMADLMAAMIEPEPPGWAGLRSLHSALLGEINQYSLMIEVGPVYLVCLSKPPDLAIGAIGPIEIVD